MGIVSTTSRGQVTLRKEFFRHLGIKPGEKLEIDLLPGGEIRGRAVRKRGKIENVFGMFAGKTDGKMSIEEMNKAIGDAVVAEYLRGVKR